MRKIFFLLCLIVVSSSIEAQTPYSFELLEKVKIAYIAKDAKAVKAVEMVISASNELLSMSPLSVTQKEVLPPSKDKRDYMTMSPYWWPDPSVEGGLPYIRRDGERNPEVYNYPERVNGNNLGYWLRTLSALYYITENEEYAKKCADFLRVWFIDLEKGMNPNMTYAQVVPGMKRIRGTGIIDARRMCFALSCASLIENSPYWSDSDDIELKAWANTFLYWLEHSVNGLKELNSQNNHGLWYDAIRIMTAKSAGDIERAKQIAKESFMPRFQIQVAADGSLPKELERTLSLHYSTFVLDGFSTARNILSSYDIDLWKMEEANRVLEYLIPYYLEPQKWPYPQISPFDKSRGAAMLYEAGIAINNNKWIETAKKIGYNNEVKDWRTLLYFEIL